MAPLWISAHAIMAMQRRGKLGGGLDWSWATVSADMAAVTAAATSGQTNYAAEALSAIPSGFGVYGTACLMQDGRMLILPRVIPGTAYIHDTVEDTFTPIALDVGVTQVVSTALLLPNGTVLVLCHRTPSPEQYADILFDPSTNTATRYTNQWHVTALGQTVTSGYVTNKEEYGYTSTGKVLLSYKTGASAPYTKILAVWDPVTNTGTTHDISAYSARGDWIYTYPCELPDGRIFLSSRNTGFYDILCDLNTDELTQVDFIGNTNSYKYHSRLQALQDGTVFRPGAGLTTNSRMNFTAWTTATPLYTGADNAAVLLPSNAVITSRAADELSALAYLLRFGPNTKQVLTLATGCYSSTRPILAPNGKLYWFPRSSSHSDNAYRWDGKFSQNFSLNTLISPWMNSGW